VKLLLCTATSLESGLLRRELTGVAGIRIIEMGVGPVNAAHAVTMAMATDPPSEIVVCGVGGAYHSSRLAIGDVVCAACEIYGDLGAQSPEGFLDMQALGFPVVAGETPLFNELPLQIFPCERRARFVTVSTCTGTDQAAAEIFRRTEGAVESMEGAAVAHVARLHGIAVGEVRGISNMVANRDKNSWRLKEAADAAQLAVISWVRSLTARTAAPKR
jgi:futalosine hydrolase